MIAFWPGCVSDLAERIVKRVQLSSDSLSTYADAVERGFGSNVDYGQISKTYSVKVGVAYQIKKARKS